MLRRFWIGGGGKTPGQARRSAALVLLWMAMGAAASASTVPPAVYSVSAWNGGASPLVRLHSPGIATVATGQSTLAANPSGLIDVSGYVDGAAHPYFSGSGNIDYYFEFSGPSGPIPVAINVHLLLDLAGSTNGWGSVTIEGVEEVCVGPSIGCPAGEIRRTLHETLSANSVYHVSLNAFAFGSSNPGTMHVLVDPVIYLDPSFTGDPSAYTYEQSAGIGNSAASVPEPATFGAGALLLAGLVAKRVKMMR